MRRWFAKFGSTSVASTSSVTPSIPASLESSSIEQQTNSPIPSPPTPFIISKSDIHWNVDFASDPCSWESCFDTHWEAAENLLENDDEVLAIFRHLSCTVQLLMMEANAQPESAIGPILDRHFTHQIMERVVDWAIAAPHFLTPTCQVNLIHLYEIVVGESHTQNHCLLVHKPILLPLLKLLDWCKRICTKLAEDATLLHFFFDFDDDCDEQFLVFNLLIPYLYDSGEVGQLARDSLLLILSVSRRLKHIGAFIAIKSNFCPVVATGLSGCFSQLSRSVGSMLYVSDDWHKINIDDIDSYSSLLDFHSSLIFCNAVIQVAHSYVVSQVINYVYHGFLLPVVLPSLLQGGQDELISSTAYYHLCLDSVTETALIQAIVKLLLIESCEDNKKVLDVIIERISAGNRLSQVTLSLVRTLIDLRCEDIMFDLIFKYLLPCTFLQPNQAFHLKNQKYVRTAAQTLLTFIPECTYKSSVLCSQESLHVYLAECRNYVQQTTDACCEKWVWNYDGRNPSFVMSKLSSDDESSTNYNGTFVRHSSVRSSMASARNGLNRYFVSRNAHITAESLRQHTPLPELGEKESSSRSSFPYDIADSSPVPDNEDDELIIPPLTPRSLMMMTSSSDYFQFAYGELSETDTEAINPNAIGMSKVQSQTVSDKGSLANTNANCDTDVEMARSFVLRGWGQIEDTETFMALMDRVPATKVKHSLEENLALIDSRIQYLDELKAEIKSSELENDEFENDTNNNDDEYHAPLGQPIECFENRGVGPFLESILRSFENMLDNSLYVTLQTTSVLAALASYPQPLIAHYLFDECMLLQPSVKNLFKILDSLKMRIDAYASSLDGFDVLLERGIKFLRSRAERYEKAVESNRQHTLHLRSSGDSFSRNDNKEGANSSKGLLNRPFSSKRLYPINGSTHPHEFRIYTHKAMESRDVTLDHARAKQFVFAAIILSQFCQKFNDEGLFNTIVIAGESESEELAATVLQHSIVVPRPKGCLNKMW
ncbi:POPLD domain protein [Dirofilaria immitis]|nr:POPLD domain protein [Dirofilaria immitis]